MLKCPWGRLDACHRSTPSRVLAAVAVTMTLWASAFIVIRAAGSHFDPGEMAAGRMLAGAGVLLAYAAWRGMRVPPRRTWPLIAAYGLAWFGAYNVVLNAAERHVDAGTAATLVNIAPLLVVLGSGLVLRQPVPRRVRLGAPVAFGGVALIGLSTSTGRADLLGVVLAVVAAVLYAVGVLLQKRVLSDIDSLTATWIAAVIGALGLTPWVPGFLAQAAVAPGAATLAVAYLGVFPTAIAFSLWAYAIARVDAGTLAASSYVVPVVAVVLSGVLLSELPSPVTILGAAVCLVGVGLAQPRPGRRSVPDDLGGHGGRDLTVGTRCAS